MCWFTVIASCGKPLSLQIQINGSYFLHHWSQRFHYFAENEVMFQLIDEFGCGVWVQEERYNTFTRFMCRWPDWHDGAAALPPEDEACPRDRPAATARHRAMRRDASTPNTRFPWSLIDDGYGPLKRNLYLLLETSIYEVRQDFLIRFASMPPIFH